MGSELDEGHGRGVGERISFRLATIDYAEAALLAPVWSRMQRAAPEVQIVVRRLERLFVVPEEELRAGGIDAAIGFFPDISALEPGMRIADLWVEENVCIARRGHPLRRGKLTAEKFAATAQVGIFYRPETRGLVDSVLSGSGLSRRLQATSPHFLTVPYLVAASDLVACVPAGLARRFRHLLPLWICKLPFSLPPFHLRLAWHERTDEDAAQSWLRGLIRETAAKQAQ